MDGGKGNHPASTCVTNTGQTTLNGAIIAAQESARPRPPRCASRLHHISFPSLPRHAQCCDTADTSDPNNCRRYATSNDDAGCIGGWPARATTFAQAAALCAAQGLSLCDISCNGKGCGYNALPVS